MTLCRDCKDRWNWRVTYINGTVIHECDGLDKHLSFTTVPHTGLVELAWLPLFEQLPTLAVDCFGDTLEYTLFRQRVLVLPVDGADPMRVTFHCVGWHAPAVAHYVFMAEDGTTFESDDINAATNHVGMRIAA